MEDIKQYISELTQYMGQNGIAVNPMPKLVLRKNSTETNHLLCPTAYYDPTTYTIVLYTANRHPKDILRSYAHELIHHDQNVKGMMPTENVAEDPMYAQNNEQLRKLEEDAYLRGNMMFRDWTDNKKYKQQ